MCYKGYGIDSEWEVVDRILLYKPPQDISLVREPVAVMHKDYISYNQISHEFNKIIKMYLSLGIKVELIKEDIHDDSIYNMMFSRDLALMTPFGAVISKMKYPIRHSEPLYMEKKLRQLDIPILGRIMGEGTFEGADALFIRDNIVWVAVGNRTNEAGYKQLKGMLEGIGIECKKVSLPRGIQHLLGVLQLVDKDKALVRIDIVPEEIIEQLQKQGIAIIPIKESEEVRSKQAMNIVSVGPSKIIMPKDCQLTEKIYLEHNIQVVATVDIDELRNGAGGLACATLILERKISERKKL